MDTIMADERALTLIQEDKHLQFNAYVEQLPDGRVDLSDAHLRSYDLRKFNLSKANLSNAYMRAVDLRGQDLSQCLMNGASLAEAKVSGVAFPVNLSPQEIMMSLQHGTRLRHEV